jgi:hypothetical protein
MQFKFRYVRTGLLVALFFVLAVPYVTHAESSDTTAIALTPTTKHYDVAAGEHVSDTFTIINNGTTSYDFKVYAKPYSVKDASYTPVFNQETEFTDAFRWITLPSVVYHLEPKQTMSVPYEILVSSGARSGGHYAAIFAEAQGTLPVGETGVTSNKSVGMLVYVDIKGSSVTKGELKNLDMPWYQPASPLTAIAKVANTGETDFSASVTFAVMDVAGDVKYQTSGEYWVLPKTERDVKYTWDKSPWFGLYKTRVSTTILGKTDVRESYIVIAPRWLLFVIFLAIMLGAIDVVRRKRTTPKHKSH